MIRRISLLLALASAAACADGRTPGNGSGPGDSRQDLRGARIGPSGYATIMDAPPAPFTPAQPGQPIPPSPDQIDRQRQFARASAFQNQVREEAQALGEKLRVAEKGNFVDLYYENEGVPHVVFRFLHDGAPTLAKYTSNPRFVAAKANYSMEELRASLDFMLKTFLSERVIQGGGIGNKANRAEIDVNVPEAEFRALARKKGVKIPDSVKLNFHATETAAAMNRPLPGQLARYVRIFPRDDRPAGPINMVESRARVVLQNGCFRVADHANALALFPLGAQLFIDEEGYLAFGTAEAPGYARVGEEIVAPGSIGEVTAPKLVAPIHAACGPGKVLKINGMQSAAAARAQYTTTTNANSLRQLRAFYGLSEADARKVFDACRKQMGSGTCALSPPPPMRREDCPSGTTFSSGLCRTSEGYIRPLPKWIADLVGTSD